jgi:hypothetical protein
MDVLNTRREIKVQYYVRYWHCHCFIIVLNSAADSLVYCCVQEVGSWAFQFHCAGCHNLLSTGSIPIPLVQTYCTCFTKLNPGTKKCASSNFQRVFIGTMVWSRGYFSQKVQNLKDFSFCVVKEIINIFSRI